MYGWKRMIEIRHELYIGTMATPLLETSTSDSKGNLKLGSASTSAMWEPLLIAQICSQSTRSN